VAAILASFHMAAESCGAAALNGVHHLVLAKADVTGIGLAPCGPMGFEDVRHLQGWPGHT